MSNQEPGERTVRKFSLLAWYVGVNLEVMEVAQKVSAEAKQDETREPREIRDPWELMARFYESQRYKDTLERFYQGKTIDPTVTEKKKEYVFLENHRALETLIDFATEDVYFKFDPLRYSPETRQALTDYVKVVEDREKMYRGRVSSEEILALDEYRYRYHQSAARQLIKDGIAPSMAVGEAIARLVLIDKGLDTPESAKEKTPEKLRRKLA